MNRKNLTRIKAINILEEESKIFVKNVLGGKDVRKMVLRAMKKYARQKCKEQREIFGYNLDEYFDDIHNIPPPDFE